MSNSNNSFTDPGKSSYFSNNALILRFSPVFYIAILRLWDSFVKVLVKTFLSIFVITFICNLWKSIFYIVIIASNLQSWNMNICEHIWFYQFICLDVNTYTDRWPQQLYLFAYILEALYFIWVLINIICVLVKPQKFVNMLTPYENQYETGILERDRPPRYSVIMRDASSQSLDSSDETLPPRYSELEYRAINVPREA